MMTPDPPVADEIRSFLTENWSFFARWDNGEAALHDIEWLKGRMCEDWRLINAGMTEAISDRDGFLLLFPSMHGRFAQDPVTPRIDFLVIGELAPDVYVVSIMQHYDFDSGKTTSRAITEVLVREDGSLRIQLVHE